jgi:hypothetical protein
VWKRLKREPKVWEAYIWLQHDKVKEMVQLDCAKVSAPQEVYVQMGGVKWWRKLAKLMVKN